MGQATAELFAAEGAHVIACDLVEPDVLPAGTDEFHALDISDREQWQSLAAVIRERHGGVDILVNCAGIVHDYEDVVNVTTEAWRQVLAVNLDGVLFGMQSIIPLMRPAGGSIVNFSSIWGIAGAAGVAAYQASKGAVRMLSKSAALSYAQDGIRVNSIHPGLVWTPMTDQQDRERTERVLELTPMGRGAEPRELAYGVLFLASDESSFMTGSELVLDGGYLAA